MTRHTTVQHSQRRRGSLLVLVVVILVVIALIGMAFLQQAKIDSFSAERYERKYMELVINGFIADLRENLRIDIYGDSSSAIPNRFSKDGLYDYPWTDYSETWEVTRGDGSTGKAGGHMRDDHYLSSTIPMVTGADSALEYYWLHLSNTGGIWLDLPAIGSNNQIPLETLIDSDVAEASSDTNITGEWLDGNEVGYEKRGYDANGDGVLDSRWTWAPPAVRDFGGRRYVVAVHMIDLNAMININTATFNTVDGTNNVEPALGYGYTPADIDMSRLFYRMSDAEWFNELGQGRLYRGIGATPPGDVWMEQASLYGNSINRYSRADEMELRYLGGLNNSLNVAIIEASMPILTRSANGGEGQWDKVDDVNNLYDWFEGNDDSNWSTRKFPAIRQMLTTLSGTAVYAPQYDQTGTGRLKLDVNRGGIATLTLQQEIERRIANSLVYPVDLSGNPTGVLYLDPIGQTILEDEIIPDYTLAILDYRDANYVPSVGAGGGVRRFGLERLPFLREAYFQVKYEERDFDDISDGDDSADTTLDEVDGDMSTVPNILSFQQWWALDGDSSMAFTAANSNKDTRALAIELGNPFAHKMEASELNGIVKILILQDGEPDKEWLFDSDLLPDIGPRKDVPPDLADTLIIFVTPKDPVSGSGSDPDGASFEADLALDAAAQKLDLTGTDLMFECNDKTIIVELQVKVNLDGVATWVTYDRLETGVSFENNFDVSYNSAANGRQDNSIAQEDAARNSNAIEYVAFGPAHTLGNTSIPPADGGDKFSAANFALAKDAKLNVGPNVLPPNFQIPHPDRDFKSVAELGWVLMFGFTETQTFPQRLATLAANRRFLDFSSTAAVADGSNGSGLPHAAMLMDQFVTVSPRYDDLDNDNDDGDNDPTTSPANIDTDIETLVPGTLNLNTAPLHILTLAAPLPEALDVTESLMQSIVDYRDEPLVVNGPRSGFPPKWRTNPGIASLGELMFINPGGGGTPADMQEIGWNATGEETTAYDLYPSPEDLTNGATRPAAMNGAEEIMARFQFLSQAYTVRSDVFAAYVVVRGYSDDDFHLGPVEEAQFVVVLDRSAMANDKGDAVNSPRILAYMRIR
jgi:hypothetical protein